MRKRETRGKGRKEKKKRGKKRKKREKEKKKEEIEKERYSRDYLNHVHVLSKATSCYSMSIQWVFLSI